MAKSDWFKIDGRYWNVAILSVTEEATVLYSDNTGRSMAVGAPIVLDPLGTFIGHKIEVAAIEGDEIEFDGLFNFLTLPRTQGVMVEMVHGQTTISYRAYVSTASRKLRMIKEDAPANHKVQWGKMTINIVPISAQIT